MMYYTHKDTSLTLFVPYLLPLLIPFKGKKPYVNSAFFQKS